MAVDPRYIGFLGGIRKALDEAIAKENSPAPAPPEPETSETTSDAPLNPRASGDVFPGIDTSRFLGNFDEAAKRISDIIKARKQQYERFAKTYIANEPEILFTIEYIVENKFMGCLLVWEKYEDSTHYEVYKKNLFKSGAEFERVLFLGEGALKAERGEYISYLRDQIGMTELEEDNIFIFHDDKAKEDRIYEYKIAASRVPKKAEEVDYDMILESKNLLSPMDVVPNPDVTLFSFAGSSLGSVDLAWLLALCNDTAYFFGKRPSTLSLTNFLEPTNTENPADFFIRGIVPQYNIMVPTNINDFLTIFKDSVSLFGVKDTLNHLVDAIGGLNGIFMESFSEAIDEERSVFSYDKFKIEVKRRVPVFKMLLDIAQSGDEGAINQLSALSITMPSNRGSSPLTSIDEFSKIFKFVNEVFLMVSYSQEGSTFNQIQQIIERENIVSSADDAVEIATNEIREDIAEQPGAYSPAISRFFGVSMGETTEDDPEDSEVQSPFGTGFWWR
jgi:hypothetical protein